VFKDPLTMHAHRVAYQPEPSLRAEEFAAVLMDSGLGATRPVQDLDRMSAMLRAANPLITARLVSADNQLVGVLRGISDGAWCCYVSELAVSQSAQGLGIGTGLLDRARRLIGPRVSLILASMPESVGFYERIGMPRLEHAYWYRRES